MKHPRREFIALAGGTMSGLWLPGCTDVPGGMDREQTDSRTNDEADGGENGNSTTQTDEPNEVKDMPALANPLPELVEAEDSEAVAAAYDLEYRNGEVKVKITLAEGAARPDDHLSEVTDEYGSTVIAWVAVEKLVDLASDKNVTLVSPYVEPKTESE